MAAEINSVFADGVALLTTMVGAENPLAVVEGKSQAEVEQMVVNLMLVSQNTMNAGRALVLYYEAQGWKLEDTDDGQ